MMSAGCTFHVDAVAQSLHVGAERREREQLRVGVLDGVELAQHDGLALFLGTVKD